MGLDHGDPGTLGLGTQALATWLAVTSTTPPGAMRGPCPFTDHPHPPIRPIRAQVLGELRDLDATFESVEPIGQALADEKASGIDLFNKVQYATGQKRFKPSAKLFELCLQRDITRGLATKEFTMVRSMRLDNGSPRRLDRPPTALSAPPWPHTDTHYRHPLSPPCRGPVARAPVRRCPVAKVAKLLTAPKRGGEGGAVGDGAPNDTRFGLGVLDPLQRAGFQELQLTKIYTDMLKDGSLDDLVAADKVTVGHR